MNPASLLLLALMFTTEAQYSREDVARIIEQSGLPAAQNVIGIDPEWGSEAQAARGHIKAAGARLHVYHQGPGMVEFGETSENWEGRLRVMLLKHHDAYSYEVDNLDQLGNRLLDWIVEQQKWQRLAGFKGKLVLKNPNPFLLRQIKSSDRVDQSLISSFVIIEVDRGGLSKTEAKAIQLAASQFGMTCVLTHDTNNYRTKKPVVGQEL